MRGSFQILPGVNISSSSVAVRSISPYDALSSYLKSLTLHVALYNEPVISLFGGAEKGRAKRPIKYSRFRILSMYIVFAVAFALLSALIGKAVTLSIIAMIIAAIAAIRGIGIGANNPANSPPVFDILRRPHVQVSHIQSAEEVYEAPGTSDGVSYMYPISRSRAPFTDPYQAHEGHLSS